MVLVSKKLKKRLRVVFEPRYGRPITNEEVEEIAMNLINYMEAIYLFKLKQHEHNTID